MDEIDRHKWKAQTFDAHGIGYPRTEKGNPSFTAGKTGMDGRHAHWLPQLIATASKYDARRPQISRRPHPRAHASTGASTPRSTRIRSEDGGDASSLRFSYSNPPLQQMPSRDKELGPLIRSVFLPEEGEIWCTADSSQQEFRFVVHHAASRKLPGAKEAAERYRTDPDTDFHALVRGDDRPQRERAKAVNFAKIYGAGVKKFAEMIGKPLSEAQAINAQYDTRLPFVSAALAHRARTRPTRLGYTELYDGARRHWNLYEVPGISAKGAGPCVSTRRERRAADPEHRWFGQLPRRCQTYTALNALIQGSAARHTKLWMRACWREGIVPLLQMHDALECSVTTREQGELVARLGCEAVKLEVPMRVESSSAGTGVTPSIPGRS